jgi:hypothetical protein
LTFLTTLRTISEQICSVFLDFSLLNYLSGYFSPFFERFSRMLALLTTHRAFLDLSLGNIYIFDVKMAKIIRNGQKKGGLK